MYIHAYTHKHSLLEVVVSIWIIFNINTHVDHGKPKPDLGPKLAESQNAKRKKAENNWPEN